MADRDSIAAAATVAVVLAVGIGFVATHGDPKREVVSHPTTDTGVAPCGAGDLVVGQRTMGGAAGTSYITATLRLDTGAEPCTVDGYPRAIPLAGGRPAGVETVPDQTLGHPRQLTVLPDRSAKVTLAWSVSHYCGSVDNDAIRLWVAPGLPLDVDGFGTTSCDVDRDEGRPPLRVGAYTYVDPRDEKGKVTGLVALNDGPGPGTGEYATSGEVEFVGADTIRTPIRPTGTYRVALPTGLYTVRVSTHQWHAGETYLAGQLSVTSSELGIYNITMPLR